jgi:hypothetical protein
MLVIEEAGLVFLANPKTATQAIRAALAPHARATPPEMRGRHINAAGYARRWACPLTSALGHPPRTFAVIRAPLERMGSWFRYRSRPEIDGHENSTRGLAFADFAEALMLPDPPPYARIGRQDRFLGMDGTHGPPVDLVFDHARLDLLEAFLSAEIGHPIRFARRNASPGRPEDLTLPPGVETRLRQHYAGEFALYDRVASAGMLASPRP